MTAQPARAFFFRPARVSCCRPLTRFAFAGDERGSPACVSDSGIYGACRSPAAGRPPRSISVQTAKALC